jgi:hypothetical protein
VKHVADPEFWKCHRKLSKRNQELADKSFALLKSDPKHPSLHFKNVGRYWSARVGINMRAVAVADGNDFIWFWVGPHSQYDKLIG